MSTKEPLYPYSSLHYSPNFASISSMEGMVPSTFSGYNFDSSYSEMPNGKRKKFNIYADTREECEERLAEMIKQKNAEIAAEKERLKAGQTA